jgi:hypothetical protein
MTAGRTTGVLQSVSALSAEEFTRDLAGSFRSVRDTLVHIIGGEWGWITYWKEPSPSSAFVTDLWTRHHALFTPNAFPDVAAVQLKWAEVERDQVEFVNCVTNESLARMLNSSHNTNQFGAPDATSGESFHLPSGSSRANDAAACRGSVRHGLPRVFSGGPPPDSRCTLQHIS